jgi:hypothetical protein
MQLMHGDEETPATGTCSCHSVCTCVPVTSCNCDLVNDFENSCIGTRIAIRLEGPGSIDDRSVREDRTVELVAAFRNIILDRGRYLPPTASP